MAEQAKKILITEDEKPLARALSLKLTKEGFAPENAFDGEEAIEKLKKGKYDFMLLDLVMPKMNGFEVLTKMKEMGDKTPVMILSNLSQSEDLKKAEEFKVKDFVIKSDMSIMDIIAKVKSHF